MGRAKDIIVKVIPSHVANAFIKKHHYSGKVVQNSNLHFGAFLDEKLHGVMSFGSPLDKRKVLPLVNTSAGRPCLWNEMVELNRMAFDSHLPRNSESRCISIAFMLIRRNAPHIKWVLSFADGTLCGDGTIYRASGFLLTGIKKNTSVFLKPSGKVVSSVTYSKAKYVNLTNGAASGKTALEKIGAKVVPGFQLRYIFLLDKTCRVTVPIIPFSKIDEFGAGMYRGKRSTIQERK